MAYEQLGNIAKTTLTSTYTAGGVSLTVASTSSGTVAGYVGVFPSNPTFRVAILDKVTGAVKALLKVTAITDGTHWGSAVDGFDGNAAIGDIVAGPWATSGGLTTLLTDSYGIGTFASRPTSVTAGRAGMGYQCTDAPYEFIFDGSIWQPILPAISLALTVPVTADWTALGSGGTRTNLLSGTSAPINVIGTTGGTGNIYGIQRSVSAGDFTHYFVLNAAVSALASSAVGVGFTDGTKTEYVALQGNGASAAVEHTTLKDSILVGGSYAAANGDTSLRITVPLSGLMVVKLTRVGTALAGYLSFDGGMTFRQAFNDTSPYLTASAVIVISDPRVAATASGFTLLSYS